MLTWVLRERWPRLGQALEHPVPCGPITALALRTSAQRG